MSVDIVWPVLLAAAFLGGALNAVAGGGSFLTLPALMLAGVPPVAANATGTLALLPGYLASCAGYGREIDELRQQHSLTVMLLLSLAGATVGAALLLLTSDQLFRLLLPWLLLLATLLFLFSPWLTRVHGGVHGSGFLPGVFAVSVYGGYFNGGMGILLMAMFALTSPLSLQQANAGKNLLSALLTLVAVLIYLSAGKIVWQYGLAMMVSGLAGGYLGAVWGRRLPPHWLRGIVVLTGIIMTTVFFSAEGLRRE